MIPLKLQYRSTTRASSTTSISSEPPYSYVHAQNDLKRRRKVSDLSFMIESLRQRIKIVSIDMIPEKQCFSAQMRGLEEKLDTTKEFILETRKQVDESVSQITRNKEEIEVISIMKEKVKESQRLLFESASSLSQMVKCLSILIGNIQNTKQEYEDSIKEYYNACQTYGTLQSYLQEKNTLLKEKQERRDSLRNEFRDKLTKNSVLRVNCNFSQGNYEAKLKQINELEQNIELKNLELEEDIRNTNSNILSLTSQIKSAEAKVNKYIIR